LSFIDIDNFQEFKKTGILEILPDSFLVRRGNAHRGHYYFICPDFPGKSAANTKPLLTFGDIRFYGDNWFVVGPSCMHPEGERYTIHKDLPFAIIKYDWLVDNLVTPFEVKTKPKENKPAKNFKRFSGTSLSEKLGLAIDMFMPENPVHTGDGRIRGNNPWHSTTSNGYVINPREGTWKCWYCKTGGGPVEAYAVSKGIIECADAGKGCLEGHWPEIYRARESEGWIDPDMDIEEIKKFVKRWNK
jgi:hypothetical protein